MNNSVILYLYLCYQCYYAKIKYKKVNCEIYLSIIKLSM